MSWVSTVLKVAQIAGQILPELLAGLTESDNANPGPYNFGGIEAGINQQKKPYFKNITNGPVAVNFVPHVPVGEKSSQDPTIIHLQKINEWFDPSRELKLYRHGTLSIYNPSLESYEFDATNGLKIIYFATGLFLTAAAANIMPSIRTGIRRNSAGRNEFYYEKTNPAVDVRNIDAKLRFNAKDGAEIDIKATKPPSELIVPIPPSTDLSGGAIATGKITIDEKTYENIVGVHYGRIQTMS